jgi:hypothetical protein
MPPVVNFDQPSRSDSSYLIHHRVDLWQLSVTRTLGRAPAFPLTEWSIAMQQQRRRIKHEKTFQERLVEEAQQFKEAAEKLPPGSHAQELLLRRARQAETASHLNQWLSSKGLQPPA